MAMGRPIPSKQMKCLASWTGLFTIYEWLITITSLKLGIHLCLVAEVMALEICRPYLSQKILSLLIYYREGTLEALKNEQR